MDAALAPVIEKFNQDLSTGGVKHDIGKPRYELIAPEFLHGLAEILTFGAEKYDEQAVTKLANKLDSLIQAEKNPALIQQRPELLNLVPSSMRNDPKKAVDYLRGGGVCKDG